ncbi:hypothetical protein L1887_14055 [Cichorium endivia]|nr:hypothetical protein L1887_14055 [Cichorium endivia]
MINHDESASSPLMNGHCIAWAPTFSETSILTLKRCSIVGTLSKGRSTVIYLLRLNGGLSKKNWDVLICVNVFHVGGLKPKEVTNPGEEANPERPMFDSFPVIRLVLALRILSYKEVHYGSASTEQVSKNIFRKERNLTKGIGI